MKYRKVIFDFDGTLADSFPWLTSVIGRFAGRYGFTTPAPEQLEKLRGYSAKQIIRELKIPLWRIPEIAGQFRKLMTQEFRQVHLFSGVGRMLRTLSNQGVSVAIVSSNSRENVRRILGAENADLISRYECRVSLFGKQAKLRKISRQSHIPPTQMIYIGDEIRDFEAARNAGIPFGAVLWGYTRPEALKDCAPAETFANVDELTRVLTSDKGTT